MSERINVLDHGYVELVDHMGTDLTPAETARMSYGAKPRGWEEGDGRLTRRLLTDRHTSPFEFNEAVFEIQAPIFVARQWVRHRTANWSEFSMRYAEAERLSGDEVLFYTPQTWSYQGQANKQSSGPPIKEVGRAFTSVYEDRTKAAIDAYHYLLGHGVAREQARMVLPVSVYTRWRWKLDFHNLDHFLRLRMDEHAQWEMQEYARAVESLLKTIWPRLMELRSE